MRLAVGAVAGAWVFNTLFTYAAPSARVAAYALSDAALLLFFYIRLTRPGAQKKSLHAAQLALVVAMVAWGLAAAALDLPLRGLVENLIFDAQVIVLLAFAGASFAARRNPQFAEDGERFIDRLLRIAREAGDLAMGRGFDAEEDEVDLFEEWDRLRRADGKRDETAPEDAAPVTPSRRRR